MAQFPWYTACWDCYSKDRFECATELQKYLAFFEMVPVVTLCVSIRIHLYVPLNYNNILHFEMVLLRIVCNVAWILIRASRLV